jgi:predicted DNA binding protein
MQELALEIPLNLTESDFPIELLQRAKILHMLKFDSSGYLFICKMSALEWTAYSEKSPSHTVQSSTKKKIVIKVLGKIKPGPVLLQVSGRWIGRDEKTKIDQSRAFGFFRSMERSSYYALEKPTISEHSISLTVVAEGDRIKRLLNGLKEFNIPYKVKKLGKLGTREHSTLGELTLQQTRVLKLAHTLGYYDIPRRTNTEDLARILRMDKATVGEHLRRAEKHVFDKLIQETS